MLGQFVAATAALLTSQRHLLPSDEAQGQMCRSTSARRSSRLGPVPHAPPQRQPRFAAYQRPARLCLPGTGRGSHLSTFPPPGGHCAAGGSQTSCMRKCKALAPARAALW
jgi:hypothetical protein